MAHEFFQRAIGTLPEIPGIRHFQRTTGHFSGDVVLYHHSPRGEIHLLVGDFTGHGLSAALGVLPTTQIFNSMTERGFPIEEIACELNHKLYRLLPTQLFLAAALVCCAPDRGTLTILNLGLPPILLRDRRGQIHQRFHSCNLPLGLMPKMEGQGCQVIEIGAGESLLIYSDGLIELGGAEPFDQTALENLVIHCPAEQLLQHIEAQVDRRLSSSPPADDITVVLAEIPRLRRVAMVPTVPPKADDGNAFVSLGKFRLELTPPLLKHTDPAPLLIRILDQLRIPRHCHQPVFLILSELINNALEHGLLRLDSKLKTGLSGFSAYLEQRRQRLAALEQGKITIEIDYLEEVIQKHQQLEITVEDSGPGFDYHNLNLCKLDQNPGQYGRGIPLLHSLCSQVTYQGRGNRVQVRYWLT